MKSVKLISQKQRWWSFIFVQSIMIGFGAKIMTFDTQNLSVS